MTSLHWGVVQISLTNLLIIVGMVMLFVVALLAPLPGGRLTPADFYPTDQTKPLLLLSDGADLENQAVPSTWVVTSGG